MHLPNAPLEYKKVSLKGVAQHDKRKMKLEDIATSKGSIHSKGDYNMDVELQEAQLKLGALMG
jgi:hypothetical protein